MLMYIDGQPPTAIGYLSDSGDLIKTMTTKLQIMSIGLHPSKLCNKQIEHWPCKSKIEDVDPEDGLLTVSQVFLLVLFTHGDLVLLVPSLLLLQLLALLIHKISFWILNNFLVKRSICNWKYWTLSAKFQNTCTCTFSATDYECETRNIGGHSPQMGSDSDLNFKEVHVSKIQK